MHGSFDDVAHDRGGFAPASRIEVFAIGRVGPKRNLFRQRAFADECAYQCGAHEIALAQKIGVAPIVQRVVGEIAFGQPMHAGRTRQDALADNGRKDGNIADQKIVDFRRDHRGIAGRRRNIGRHFREQILGVSARLLFVVKRDRMPEHARQFGIGFRCAQDHPDAAVFEGLQPTA